MSEASPPAAPPRRDSFVLGHASRERVLAVLQRCFRPLGRPVAWTDPEGVRARGFLLEGGALFDCSEGFPWVSGRLVQGELSPADATPAQEFVEVRSMLVEMASPRLGAWGAFNRETVSDLEPFAEEANHTTEWIRHSMGESEFRWDTLAVERSMLRTMMGAVYFDKRFSRFRLAELLLEGAEGLSEEQIGVAASMAEFDGQGVALTNDFYMERPGPAGGPGLRELVHKHLLLNSGRFLCNYKRRFLIQNAFGLSDERRVELHRELLVGDLTEEAKRAVWIDWSRRPAEWPAIPRERYLKNMADQRHAEEFDCALRLWRQLARPSRELFGQVKAACQAFALAEALEAEAALFSRSAKAIHNLGDPGCESTKERLNERLTLFALEGKGPDAGVHEWREFSRSAREEAALLRADAARVLEDVSDEGLRERLSAFLGEEG